MSGRRGMSDNFNKRIWMNEWVLMAKGSKHTFKQIGICSHGNVGEQWNISFWLRQNKWPKIYNKQKYISDKSTTVLIVNIMGSSFLETKRCRYAIAARTVTKTLRFSCKPGIERVQSLADISRSRYVVIATKFLPVHRLRIRPIVHY